MNYRSNQEQHQEHFVMTIGSINRAEVSYVYRHMLEGKTSLSDIDLIENVLLLAT